MLSYGDYMVGDYMVGDYVITNHNGLCKVKFIEDKYFGIETKDGIDVFLPKNNYQFIPKDLIETEIGQLIWHTPA